ncbi:TPA: RNA-guided endonuclease InsQ/TnpB family protein [Clostridioides difficile]|uniref:RNA-guided endonuclease InsQ/TnpB family protein n=1 Tax=Clostridioides difficile TaxID=1496 RepID=UPI0004095A60|nr:RNA-guided endonuclease TnpB family protein [Clostridioides difficile]AXU28210.1 transposase [Clostridioides difficile]AXU32007.1 transposase [Clostridioides difficile]AXU35795.1 transposase [Clostridioides difficile]KJF62872.1 transposase [Clostridioides difficile]MBY1131267.1 transposase [Clostridioides difficile]
MIKAIKVRLYPTKKQEVLMFKSAGISRFSYNWGLAFLNKYYEENNKFLQIDKLRKEFTRLRNNNEFSWLKEVSSEIPQQALKDLGESFKKFFKKESLYPRFKKKGKCEVSFFHLNNKFVVKENYIKLEKIGYVKMKDEGRLPIGNYKKDKIKVLNPRVKFNGKYWYLSLAMEVEEKTNIKLTNESVGVDLGIKDLAIVSNIDEPFKNINKSKEVKRLNKKLRKLQRQVSRKYDMLKSGNTFQKGEKLVKTKNIIKVEKQIKLVYKKLSDIRLNHIHQTTNTIVKTKPCRIVVEDLNVRGLLKNKHLSKSISEQCFNKFINILEYKCKWNKIEFVKADRFYPSSKMCSCCGTIKKDLKLKDRTYVCSNEKCNLVIDRDKNASINLANYKSNYKCGYLN